MSLTAKRNLLKPGLHLLGWLFIFGLPYLVIPRENGASLPNMLLSLIMTCSYVVIFYTNYLLLVDRLLFRKRIITFVLINLILITGMLIISSMLRNWTIRIPPAPEPPAVVSTLATRAMPRPFGFPRLHFIFFPDIALMLLPAIFALAIRSTENWLRSEAEKKENANQRLQSELQHLKHQLHPHFFFNSLNNIFSLVDADPEKAKHAIHALGRLMRYLLYETDREKVPLQKEIEFTLQYIDLMRLRISPGRTELITDFPLQVSQQVEISPLLLISVIENAFKHGISATQKSSIRFRLKVENDILTFTSVNTNLPKDNKDKSGSGIGLGNLKKRLDLLYPDRYVFDHYVSINEYITQLCIHLDK